MLHLPTTAFQCQNLMCYRLYKAAQMIVLYAVNSALLQNGEKI